MHPLFTLQGLSVLTPVCFLGLQLAFAEGQSDGPKAGLDSKELVFLVQIICQVTSPATSRKSKVLVSHIILSFFSLFFFPLSRNQGRNWLVKRSYEDFRVLDKHLHLCIYDRRYSELSELPRYDTLKDTVEVPQSSNSIISHLVVRTDHSFGTSWDNKMSIATEDNDQQSN